MTYCSNDKAIFICIFHIWAKIWIPFTPAFKEVRSCGCTSTKRVAWGCCDHHESWTWSTPVGSCWFWHHRRVQHYNARLLLTKCRPKPPTFLLHIAAAFGPPHFIPRYRTSSPNTVRLCSLGFEVCTITPGLWHSMILEICRHSKPSAETGKCECFGEKRKIT